MFSPPMRFSRLARALDPRSSVGQAKGRSKHMDEWDIDAVVDWFHAVGYTQYDKSIREHQVKLPTTWVQYRTPKKKQGMLVQAGCLILRILHQLQYNCSRICYLSLQKQCQPAFHIACCYTKYDKSIRVHQGILPTESVQYRTPKKKQGKLVQAGCLILRILH